MRLRKAEREQLTALLDREWGAADEAAQAMFDEALRLLMDRKWLVLVAEAGGMGLVYGPFADSRSAVKASAVLEQRGRVWLRPLVTSVNDVVDADDEGAA